MDADSFEALWEQTENVANELFSRPPKCNACGSTELCFWRLGSGFSGAHWRCEDCETIEFVCDNWLAAENILRETGASDDDITKVKEIATQHGIDPIEAANQVIRFNKERVVRETMPPPPNCYKCGEITWELDSTSPNAKAVKWKCSYCGRIELITSTEEHDPKKTSRKSISKGVQRDVWRRDRGRCQNCGTQENLEFDHIIPVARGGSSTVRNIQLLCERCNRLKSDREPGAE